MYSANNQHAEQKGYFVHSYKVQITFQGPAHHQRHAIPVKARTFLNSFLGTLHLVEEAEELAGNVLAASLLVVHDTGGGGQDDVTELTGGKELSGPLLEVTELDGVAGVDDTTLVEAREGRSV
jgi:hypothetical protein